MKKIILLSIALLLSIYVVNAQTVSPTYSDVDYVGKGNSKQMLDIYIPSSVNKASATIVHIHGGAFMMGSKGTSGQSAFIHFYNNGYICVDINYRLSSDSLWPAQVFDCKAAIRYLKANAAKYNIDTCKIGVVGESAGGNLVSMLGTTAEVPELEGLHLGNTNVTSRVHAVIDLYGPINFLTMDAEAAALGFSINTNGATSPESKLMGAAIQTIPELVKRANPTTYITKDDAAFFISAGTADKNIPYTQGQNFANALIQVIGSERAGFELLQGAGHGGSAWNTTEQNAKYVSFFNAALTGCNPTDVESENRLDTEINIYPNPVKDMVTISIPENNYNLEVYNSYGQLVFTQNNVSNSLNISSDNFPVGLYIIKLTSSNDVLTKSFIKQ